MSATSAILGHQGAPGWDSAKLLASFPVHSMRAFNRFYAYIKRFRTIRCWGMGQKQLRIDVPICLHPKRDLWGLLRGLFGHACTIQTISYDSTKFKPIEIVRNRLKTNSGPNDYKSVEIGCSARESRISSLSTARSSSARLPRFFAPGPRRWMNPNSNARTDRRLSNAVTCIASRPAKCNPYVAMFHLHEIFSRVVYHKNPRDASGSKKAIR